MASLYPPFVLAFFSRDASTIVAYCGLLGFVFMFFLPGILQWVSITTLRRRWPAVPRVADTPDTGPFSTPAAVGLIMALAFVGFAFNATTVLEDLRL